MHFKTIVYEALMCDSILYFTLNRVKKSNQQIAVEFRVCISNYISTFYMDVNINPWHYPDNGLIFISNRGYSFRLLQWCNREHTFSRTLAHKPQESCQSFVLNIENNKNQTKENIFISLFSTNLCVSEGNRLTKEIKQRDRYICIILI